MRISHLWEQSFVLFVNHSRGVTKGKLCECEFMWSVVGRIFACWHTKDLHIWGERFRSCGKCWELLLPLLDRYLLL